MREAQLDAGSAGDTADVRCHLRGGLESMEVEPERALAGEGWGAGPATGRGRTCSPGGGTEGLLVIRSPGDHGGDARCAGPPSWADALRPGNMEPRSHGVVGVPVTFCPGPLGPCDSLWIKGPLRDSVLQPWDSRGWGRKAPGRAICRVCGGWVCIRATLGAACLFVREIPPCGRVQFLTEIFPGSL